MTTTTLSAEWHTFTLTRKASILVYLLLAIWCETITEKWEQVDWPHELAYFARQDAEWRMFNTMKQHT